MSFKRLDILCKAPYRNRNRKNICSDHHKHVTKKYVCNKDCFSTRMTGGGTGTVAKSCFHLGPHGVHTECLSRRLHTTSGLFTGVGPMWVGSLRGGASGSSNWHVHLGRAGRVFLQALRVTRARVLSFPFRVPHSRVLFQRFFFAYQDLRSRVLAFQIL